MTSPVATRNPLIHVNDPDHVLVRRAARVALVLPLLFWFCARVLDQPEAALFASFGAFAMLAMADFGGPLPRRAAAYLIVTALGAVLLFIGTLATASVPVAVALMAVVGFAVAYAGALGGYYVAAAPPLTLAYVLAATVPEAVAPVPERVTGWVAAGVISTVAAIVLWPAHERRRIGEAIATACRGVAGALRSGADADAGTAREEVRAARLRFWKSPRRPAGPSEHDRAVLHILDALDWLAEILATPGGIRGHDDDLLEITATTLDRCADGVEAQQPVPVDDIGAAREHHLHELHAQVRTALEQRAPVDAVVARVGASFLPRAASLAAERAATAATAARTHPSPRSARPMLRRTLHLLRAHLHLRSVWLRNSLRMGLALAVAVGVALAGNLPHAFWVALGTLTALRSNALGTGRTVATALLGTVIGFAVSVAVLAAAVDDIVLWVVLPVAVFLSAWAPTALSFVVGQASFTVFVVVLFNLLQPVGWKVGEQRIEDIAIGCGVGLLVSIIFWPRGASTQLRQALRESVEADGRWFTAELDHVLRVGGAPAPDASTEAAAREAQWRADQALIVYLDERGAHRLPVERAQALVNSGDFLQLAASSLAMGSGIDIGADGPCPLVADTVATRGDAAVAALAAVSDDEPEPSLGPPLGDEIERCFVTLERPADRAAVDGAVRLVFASEWVDRVGVVAARLASSPDQQSVTPEPRRHAMNTDGS